MLNKAKEVTTKSLSHEAKSHLTVIYGYIQLLQTYLNNSDNDLEKLNILIIKTLNSCNNLSSILESLDKKISP